MPETLFSMKTRPGCPCGFDEEVLRGDGESSCLSALPQMAGQRVMFAHHPLPAARMRTMNSYAGPSSHSS